MCIRDRATGEYEVTITCGYPCAIDLIVSAGYAAYVMSDSVIEQPTEWFNEGHDGGTGPYTIAQATGDSVVLKAYEDYRGGWQDNQYKNCLLYTSQPNHRRNGLRQSLHPPLGQGNVQPGQTAPGLSGGGILGLPLLGEALQLLIPPVRARVVHRQGAEHTHALHQSRRFQDVYKRQVPAWWRSRRSWSDRPGQRCRR